MQQFWDWMDWIDDHEQTLAACMLLAIFILVLGLAAYHMPWSSVYAWLREKWGKYAYPLRWLRRWKRLRDYQIRERQALIRFWADVLCQAGENAVHAGQFTREQVDTWYSVFGKNADLTSLLPKNLALTRRDQRNLKSAILKRIGPGARLAFKEKQENKERRVSSKIIRSQFRRAFRRVAL